MNKEFKKAELASKIMKEAFNHSKEYNLYLELYNIINSNINKKGSIEDIYSEIDKKIKKMEGISNDKMIRMLTLQKEINIETKNSFTDLFRELPNIIKFIIIPIIPTIPIIPFVISIKALGNNVQDIVSTDNLIYIIIYIIYLCILLFYIKKIESKFNYRKYIINTLICYFIDKE